MKSTSSYRLLSLDTLRGMDMLFIMGFAELVVALCALFPSTFGEWVGSMMHHCQWDGLTHHDTIFPLFLFIAGVSFPFSLAKQHDLGRTNGQIYRKTAIRFVVLVVLGMVYNGLLQLNFPVRVASVLGRIGFAWAVAAVLFVACKTRTRVIIAAAILVGYWLLLWLVKAPDAPAGYESLSYEGNLVGYVDRLLLPGRLLQRPPEGVVALRGWFDPEGLLSALPAVVTAMIGMFAGQLLRSDRISGGVKSLRMAVGAVAFLIVGLLWAEVMPVNKRLWSSSFVCILAAWSLGWLSLLYYIVDVRGWRRWTLFFRVIGINSLTIYLLQAVVDFGSVSSFFFGGVASKCSPQLASVVDSAGYVAVCWLVLYFLYRRNIFFKV